MKEFRDYDILFPELAYDILDYFRDGNIVRPNAKKSVLDYCRTSHFKNQLPEGEQIQPSTVFKICENFAKKGYLNRLSADVGILGMKANYLYLPSKEEIFLSKPSELIFRLNCIAYGFRYIYNEYRKYVLPIIVKKDGDISMGTCFRYYSGIITAKHCLEVDEVLVDGISSSKLNQSQVIISQDSKLDMAYIDLNEPCPLVSDCADVLDEVLVMGYPKIPQFFDFCTAERAAISSIPTRGSVASLAGQYITPGVKDLMLITARIRGGNSGGPVIDSNGAVVGVSFAEATAEGDYDEMGYGIAYPIAVLDQVFQNPTLMKVNFVDAIN